MHPNVVEEAIRYDRHIDLPMWMSTLSLNDKSVPFYEQKDLECDELDMKAGNQNGEDQGKKRGPKILNGYGLEKKSNKKGDFKDKKATFKVDKEVKRFLDDVILRVEEIDQDD